MPFDIARVSKGTLHFEFYAVGISTEVGVESMLVIATLVRVYVLALKLCLGLHTNRGCTNLSRLYT